jgi:hypothetical protein
MNTAHQDALAAADIGRGLRERPAVEVFFSASSSDRAANATPAHTLNDGLFYLSL